MLLPDVLLPVCPLLVSLLVLGDVDDELELLGEVLEELELGEVVDWLELGELVELCEPIEPLEELELWSGELVVEPELVLGDVVELELPLVCAIAASANTTTHSVSSKAILFISRSPKTQAFHF